MKTNRALFARSGGTRPSRPSRQGQRRPAPRQLQHCAPRRGHRDGRGDGPTAHGLRELALGKRCCRSPGTAGSCCLWGRCYRSRHTCPPHGPGVRTGTQSEMGSASERGSPHASLLPQPVASPGPCHADGARESHQCARDSPTSLRPQGLLQSVAQPRSTYFSRLSCSSRQDKASGCSAKGRASSAQRSRPPRPSAVPLPRGRQLTFVFEVLQDGDDGLQRNAVRQEELPGAVLLKGLPVQALN